MARPAQIPWFGLTGQTPQQLETGRPPRRRRQAATAPAPAVGLPRPPSGTYDPSIDASERAAQRGYHDVQSDTSKQNVRSAADFSTQMQDIGRQRDYGLADILRSETRGGQDLATQRTGVERDFGRGMADLLTARTRGTEDYNASVGTLNRNYQRLGSSQAQALTAGGAGGGGAFEQAQAKRTANQAIDRAPLDANYGRFMADSQQSQQRLDENHTQAVAALDLSGQRAGEDIGTARQRLTAQLGTGESTYKPGSNAWADAWLAKNPGQQLPGGPHDVGYAGLSAALSYQRGNEDRATNVQRAGRELNAYQQDLVPTRYYSAAGLTPYTAPKRKKR